MRVESSAEVRLLSVVGGKLVGLCKVALITSAPLSFFLLYKLKQLRYLSQCRLSFKRPAVAKSPQKFTFLKPYIMKQKTTIQKVKELIEEVNLSKKRAFEGLLNSFTLLEVMEEEPHLLVIRASDFDCFSIPDALIKASGRLHLRFMVSTRFRYNDQNDLIEYPVLAIRF